MLHSCGNNESWAGSLMPKGCQNSQFLVNQKDSDAASRKFIYKSHKPATIHADKAVTFNAGGG